MTTATTPDRAATWTKHPPTEPGYYWRRTGPTAHGTIVLVGRDFDPDTGVRTLGLVRGAGVVPLHLLGGCEWAGPVPRPAG
jgi:hypothetical protein